MSAISLTMNWYYGYLIGMIGLAFILKQKKYGLAKLVFLPGLTFPPPPPPPPPGVGGGGGSNFHYKRYIQMCGWKGYTFQASKYMNGYHFHIKNISIGYLFHPKSMIWEVYEWVMFFT